MPLVVAGQAIALAGIGVVLDDRLWPAGNPAVLVPLITLVLIWPTLVLFVAEPRSFVRTATLAGASALVSVVLGIYVGWQAMPVGEFRVDSLYPVYGVTMLAAGFVWLPFMQCLAGRERIAYQAVFASAWRNLLVAGLSLALLVGVALLLALWAALFYVLGIRVLVETFTELWFVLPTIGIAFGTGTILFRRRIDFIDGIVDLVESLARYLLAVVLFIVPVFFLTLLFVGVQALWAIGLGSRILIALVGVAVLLVAMAYRPGADFRYPRPVQLAIAGVVGMVPVLALLAAGGILIRVGQYGWTVSRCWAFTGAAVLVLVSLGYLWGVIHHRAEWSRAIAPVNVSAAGLVLAVLLLQNTPVLDFRAISARSQLARVESGEIEAAQFDFRYAHRELARPGNRVAEQLVEQLGFDPRDQETDFVSGGFGLTTGPSGGVVLRDSSEEMPDRDLWAEMRFQPEPFAVPDGVRAAVDDDAWLFSRTEHPTLLRVDLDGDPVRMEYLLLGVHKTELPGWQEIRPLDFYGLAAYALVHDGDDWYLERLMTAGGNQEMFEEPEPVLELLRDPPLTVLRPRFNHLRIGDTVFGMLPGEWTSDDAPSAPTPAAQDSGS